MQLVQGPGGGHIQKFGLIGPGEHGLQVGIPEDHRIEFQPFDQTDGEDGKAGGKWQRSIKKYYENTNLCQVNGK